MTRLSSTLAGAWTPDWDAQQEGCMPRPEERFAESGIVWQYGDDRIGIAII